MNGDGFDDLIVGAIFGGDSGNLAGQAYVVFGGAGGFGSADGTGRQVIDLTNLTAAEGFIIQGDTEGDALGGSVSSAGDVNGDGFDDLIVGATGGDDGGNNAGEAYVLFGGAGGFGSADGTGRQVIDLTNLTAAEGFIIQGDTEGDALGVSVSSAGDVNGDGFDDLIVGATAGDDGGSLAGEAYVIFGSATGTESTVAVSATGTAVADNSTGNAGDDIFSAIGANDVVRGGAGDNTITFDNLNVADINGGTGTDTLALSASGLLLDLRASGSGTSEINSIEVIDISSSGANTVILDQLAIFDLTEKLSEGIATITIFGDADDTADLVGGFTAAGDVTDGGTTFNLFTIGNATVREQDGISVIDWSGPDGTLASLLGASNTDPETEPTVSFFDLPIADNEALDSIFTDLSEQPTNITPQIEDGIFVRLESPMYFAENDLAIMPSDLTSQSLDGSFAELHDNLFIPPVLSASDLGDSA